MKKPFLLISCLLLGGCSSSGESQRILNEKNRIAIERDEFRQELIALKQDWAILQDENSSAKLIQELREKLQEAHEYKSATQEQLNSNTETIESLRSEISTLKKTNEETNNTLKELQNKLAAYQTPEGATTRQQVDSSVYAGTGTGHWILENMNNGEFIKLEDGSLWETSPFDRIHAALWLPISRITILESRNPVYPYVLINSDDGEKAEAKLIAGITLDKGAAPADASDSLIQSIIDGDFEGWDGDTIFKLTNGQVWQQASYAYTYHYAFMPKVLIYRTTGGYKMKVDRVQSTIFVRRLR
jgi:hypothetical protein